MSTITEVETTPQAIEDVAGRLFSEGVGAFHLGTVYIGLKHGLFEALVADGPLTAAELANRTRLDGWYVREWLQAETTAGLLLADDDDCPGRGSPPHQGYVTCWSTKPARRTSAVFPSPCRPLSP